MSFKVEKKDFFLFVLYSILLLYLCAIAVLNFSSLASDGTFYGLIPFKAFLPKYLFATLLLYIIAMVIIFTSVSSYIFDKDKNGEKNILGIFGLKIGEKSSDGYSRWATAKEIKNDSRVERVTPQETEVTAAGIPLISDKKEIFVDNGDYHNLVIGSTGSGKTQTIVHPMVTLLTRKGESMIITDPKGEIYRHSSEYMKQKGYNIILLNFREPQNGNSWNPLTLPYQYYKEGNIDKATELLDDVALNILYEKGESNDPFWQRSSADYFSGLVLGLFEDAKEEEINLNSINYMSTVGEERYAMGTFIQEYFKLKGESSSAYVFASNTINAPSETKGGILSTFRQKIRMFATQQNLSEMLSYSNFDMRDIGKQKTAVFLVIHDEKKTYHGLMTIFIKQCYETLIDVAQANGGKLKQRTNFILDEFANMPPLKDVDSMVSSARSRDIRFTFIIQNYAQLNEVYGEQIAEVIKGNCGNIVYLISTELKALEEISKMCGEVKSSDKDKTASTPLVTVSDLQKLKLFQAIIIRLRTNPFKTQLEPYFKIDWGEKWPVATYPKRTIREVELFDVKKFVTEEKKKQTMNNPTAMGPGFNPFGGAPMNMNPFGMPHNNPNPFNMPNNKMDPITDDDIEKMLAEIDKKIKDLDEEEKALKNKDSDTNKEVEEKPKSVEQPTPSTAQFEDNNPFIQPVKKEPQEERLEKEEIKKEINEEPKIENLEKKEEPKPVINIDDDSVVVNEDVVSDDEYFDDFFGEDE